ncbi:MULTISPECIES: DUF5677 domain-containing protein [Psychrilyobacter]|uniref:Uncharacterized protein n=1 Tax=Psychrilyobacter piezotolerans TaxID=2293438 RepID=A0ABX9KLC5_9FUSO|nr:MULTISPECIES: DUF5677 domain-containing protein [Psychrilyobacter]MCS5422621.1 DUF5677 domain-containing protein [Psychrilyobacter sp. S5]NDI76477.1 hypothetical protein [Psychrilyobacter piezotolerans]RDE66071.1 hypothetical protein DV867_00925 [Psychrilyobacter sp. S5]REI43249.1 hypothetical protein DYH56_00925 [Psychrilyobacter piezotolerans]
MGITKQELTEEATDKTKEMYVEFSVMLEEVIQKGLDIVVSLNESKVTGREEKQQQIMISILKEILEKIDGIIILSEKYSQQNISVLARSVLDGFLDLNFMLKAPKRALAYIYCKSLDYLSKYEKMELSADDQEGIKSIQQQLGDELKKQRGKKKESNDHRLNWKSFYFDEKTDDPYKSKGAKIHYSLLCAETHNQGSIIHSYSEDNSFKLRGFRDTSKTEIGLISQIIARFSGEIFDRMVKLYIREPSSNLEKWREEIFEKSEKLIKLDNERLAGTTKLNAEI